MSVARERFRSVLERPECTLAANIFDPISARIAEMVGFEVCVLSSTVAKSASVGLPDLGLANLTDIVDHCRRILRVADVSLMVDADDGFGGPVNVFRAVRDLEAAGVSAIEVDDNLPRTRLDQERTGLVSSDYHVAKLKAAVDARQDPTTVIVARTSALIFEPLDAALERIREYAASGVDALMLYGLRDGRADIAAVHEATDLPLLVHPPEDADDPTFLAATGVRIRMVGQVAFSVAVRAMYDALLALRNGQPASSLSQGKESALTRQLTRFDEYLAAQKRYDGPE